MGLKLSDFSPSVQRRIKERAAAMGCSTVHVTSRQKKGTLQVSKPRSKYGSVKSIAGGIEFDSQKEARRYQDLTLLARAGLIRDLHRQVEFRLIVNRSLVCTYVADFVYIRDGRQIVEDVKSKATRKNRAYRIKVKLLKALEGIDVKEV